MPTVIDELIVKLSMDPSGFDEGERRLADSLKRVESAAQRSGNSVAQSASHGVTDFFRTIQAPQAGLRRMFEQFANATEQPNRSLRVLEDQGKRTGESVESGALAGARGLRVMGAAGLGLFAAYEGLSKVISSANEGAAKLFSTGIGAAAANLPIQEYTALGIAFNTAKNGNVPAAQTQATLSAWHSAAIAAHHGGALGAAAQAELNELTNAAGTYLLPGLNFYNPDATEKNLLNLAEDLHKMPTQDAAMTAGQAMGLTPEQAFGYYNTGRPSDADLAAARQQAATESQLHGATDLTQATNKLEAAWDHLGRTILNLESGPLVKLDNWMEGLVERLAKLGDENAPVTGFNESTGGQGGWWQRNMPGALGGNTKSGQPWSLTSPWSDWGFGGKPQNGSSSPGPTGSISPTSAIDPSITSGINYFMSKGLTRAQATGVAARLAEESGNGLKIDPNAVNPSSGAYGAGQWLGNRQPAALATGGDLTRQFDLAWQELNGPESAALQAIRQAQTPSDAARAMEKFERAGNPDFTEKAARRADEIYGQTQPASPTSRGLLGSLNPIGTANASLPPNAGDPGTTGGIPGNYAGFLQDPRNLRLGGAVGRPDLHEDVVRWLNDAQHVLPPGYHAELRAGPANHTQGTYTGGAVSQVTLGQAADIDIVDPSGKHLPNPVDTGQFDPLYKVLGEAYVQASGGQGRWGGNYGRPDPMQYGTVAPGYPAGANAPAIADLQRAQAVAGDTTTVTHNAGDVNLHGDIVVHAPMREGNAIGDAVAERVKRVSLASMANTGLE